MPPKQNTVALWSYCWNKLLLLYYRNALARVKILRFISLSTSSRLCILKKWFIKSNSWQNTTKQNQHFENTKILTLTLDIRILDGFMNISASSNCPQIPSNMPLLKEKKKKQKPKTSHHRTKEKAEVWRFCSFGDYFSSTSHSWKHCLCEHWRTRGMISSLAPWSGSVLVTPSRSDPWWITWSLILALAKAGSVSALPAALLLSALYCNWPWGNEGQSWPLPSCWKALSSPQWYQNLVFLPLLWEQLPNLLHQVSFCTWPLNITVTSGSEGRPFPFSLYLPWEGDLIYLVALK